MRRHFEIRFLDFGPISLDVMGGEKVKSFHKRFLSLAGAFFVILIFQNCTGFTNPSKVASGISAQMGPGDAEPIEGKPLYDYNNPDKVCFSDGSHLISKIVVENDMSLSFIRLNCENLTQPQIVAAGAWTYGATDHSVVLYKGQNFILEGAVNPCAGKNSGEACADASGNTRGYFIASNQGSNYMITPSLCGIQGSSENCWNVTNEVLAAWEPVTGFTGATSSDGLMNSWMLEGLGNGAAQVCRKMNYGGFTDWFLPSASEMLTVLMPNGRSIPGYTGSPPPMWSSTEFAPGNSLNSVQQSQPNESYAYVMTDGGVIIRPKSAGTTIRCIRRF
jgi:hypothetical protein